MYHVSKLGVLDGEFVLDPMHSDCGIMDAESPKQLNVNLAIMSAIVTRALMSEHKQSNSSSSHKQITFRQCVKKQQASRPQQADHGYHGYDASQFYGEAEHRCVQCVFQCHFSLRGAFAVQVILGHRAQGWVEPLGSR